LTTEAPNTEANKELEMLLDNLDVTLADQKMKILNFPGDLSAVTDLLADSIDLKRTLEDLRSKLGSTTTPEQVNDLANGIKVLGETYDELLSSYLGKNFFLSIGILSNTLWQLLQ
jgi:hypothetical protein